MSLPLKEQILIAVSDTQVRFLLERVLTSNNFDVKISETKAEALELLPGLKPSLIIISEKLNDSDGIDFATELIRRFPAVPLILFVNRDTPELIKKAMRVGISDYLCLPLYVDDVIKSVQYSLEKARQRRDWVISEAKRATGALQRQVDELKILADLGRSITSSLDLDGVLTAIVDAAVELTGAEEGNLLMIDLSTGELYMRAARNFQEEFVRTFRLPVKDSLISSVLRTGEPVLLDEKTPQKIKTAYLVHSLIYVPLKLHGQVIGVLGVDNRMQSSAFKERDLRFLNALAEYAVVALENARLYEETAHTKNKLETILTNIQDGVIVIDQDRRLSFVNQLVLSAFEIETDSPIIGHPFAEVFPQPELQGLLSEEWPSIKNRGEIVLKDGRFFSMELTPVEGVGFAIALHDITYLKKLDRIKSEFVSTVSHDLRSPLTAIMGYVELVEKAGSINDTQRDFIRRVQISVNNVTNLVDDLLNLGRIESGFDLHKESVQLNPIILLSLEGFRKRISEKKLEITFPQVQDIPKLSANPVQMRQLVDNMLDNAIKYSVPNGRIIINLTTEQNQLILRVMDTGIGIPTIDLPYIFDKFYRASNTSSDVAGTGLGLSIVKSIVENHSGRIWVDSTPGKGSIFTVVLPIEPAKV